MREATAHSGPASLPWTERWLAAVQQRFAHASTEELLRWAVETFSPNLCLATSFGPQSIVLMHMLSGASKRTTVFYLDTDLLFDETYALMESLRTRLGIEFRRVSPALTLDQQAATHGPELWARDPDRCCHLRKVLPLRRFLADKEAWITGVRRGLSGYRASAALVEWDAANGLVKLNPLLHWTSERVWDYLRRYDLPTNSLHARGYPSIGCRPCTHPVRDGEDSRAGRWPGFAKTECGIHTRLLKIEP